MKPHSRRDLIEAIGVIAIVASLIFVGLEMRQNQSIALSERQQPAIPTRAELASVINEHAEIWVRGVAGEDLDETESLIFENLVVSMNDFFFHNSSAARMLGDTSASELMTHSYSAFLHANPGARRVFEAREAGLRESRTILMPDSDVASPWVGMILSDLEKLDLFHAGRSN